MALLVFALPHPSVATDPAASPSGAPAKEVSLDEFDHICGKVLQQAGSAQASPKPADPLAGASAQQQKLDYCKAAQSAKEAADANSAMWKVWAAVAGVCTAMCISSLAGAFTNQYVCAGANIAAGITDAVVTKEFMSALTALGSTGISLVLASQSSGPNAKDLGSCLTAAVAAGQSFMKYMSMQSSEKSAKSNLQSARDVQSDAVAADTLAQAKPLDDSQKASGEASAAGGGANGGGANPVIAAPGDGKGGCAAARTSGQAQGLLSCALSSDVNLPAFVRGNAFPKEFQKDAGAPLGDFLSKASNPKQALAAAMSGQMNTIQSGKLVAALDQMESKIVANDDPSAAYAGGGGGGGGNGGEGGGGLDPALGEMMAGLMAQLNPKTGEPAKPLTGVDAVVFANARRSPAQVAHDPTLSIFDRITYRYHFVGKRLLFDEGRGN